MTTKKELGLVRLLKAGKEGVNSLTVNDETFHTSCWATDVSAYRAGGIEILSRPERFVTKRNPDGVPCRRYWLSDKGVKQATIEVNRLRGRRGAELLTVS